MGAVARTRGSAVRAGLRGHAARPLAMGAWPVKRCRCAAASAASASAASASASASATPPRPLLLLLPRQHVRAATFTASAAAAESAPSQAAGTKASTSAVLLRALARRHPPPRHLMLLAAAAPAALALAAVLFLLAPTGAASASEGATALSGAGLELFEAFLDQVKALGIWGPVAFVFTVMLCEMVPLFPTQPLALSSGLLFGPVYGAGWQLLAVTLAAINAFFISRTVGRSLAERVIREELGQSAAASLDGGGGAVGDDDQSQQQQNDAEGNNNNDNNKPGKGGLQAIAGGAGGGIARATRAIEEGGPFKQFTAVLLLRLTPVVPYSASNYLLGLTPLGLTPYIAGTIVGMLPWTVLYAGVGGASRRLLQRGVSVDVLMADLSERAAVVSGNAAGVAVALVALAAVAYLLSQQQQQQQQQQQRAAAAAAAAAAEGGCNGESAKTERRP